MNKIRIDEAGHFYLNEYDISPFVIEHSVLSDEKVTVILQGNVSAPHKKRVLKKKVVKDER
jgi:hypothetical protein